jgi:hypothetical protein
MAQEEGMGYPYAFGVLSTDIKHLIDVRDKLRGELYACEQCLDGKGDGI